MDIPLSTDQLIDGSLPDEAAQALMAAHGFADPPAALRHLRQIIAQDGNARPSLSSLLPHLLTSLSACAGPDQALINLERFAGRTRAGRALEQLAGDPRALEILITIFAGSQFLTEILLRDPQHLAMLAHR